MANGEQSQRGSMVPNIFTEKIVGIFFAVAFGLWAWYLNSLAETVMQGVNDLRSDNRALTLEIHQVKSELIDVRLQVTQQTVQLYERQDTIRRRLDQVENRVDQRYGREPE